MFSQAVTSGKLSAFDFGAAGNMKHYNQVSERQTGNGKQAVLTFHVLCSPHLPATACAT